MQFGYIWSDAVFGLLSWEYE